MGNEFTLLAFIQCTGTRHISVKHKFMGLTSWPAHYSVRPPPSTSGGYI